MRINVAENEAKNLQLEANTLEKSLKDEKEKNKQLHHRNNLQVDALERHLREETERHRITQASFEKLRSKVKANLESQVQRLQEGEVILKEEQAVLLSEVQTLKGENEGLSRRLREQERQHAELLEHEVKAAEARVKTRLEKSWLEKLKRTEENAALDMERSKDAHRRVESDLRKEVTMAQKNEVEAKRLNEELKKKVRQLRQSESELQQRLTAAESADIKRERSVSRSSSSAVVSSQQDSKELAALQGRYDGQVE
ncbi:trichohyalin, partial [Hyalella azteca]|uniref:Trichohyalin n=1 Tax=Hyalella azteca TaxID=294128 RepID=A0A8B7N6W2_HYAAZ